jgi:uncharacterized membrane protein
LPPRNKGISRPAKIKLCRCPEIHILPETMQKSVMPERPRPSASSEKLLARAHAVSTFLLAAAFLAALIAGLAKADTNVPETLLLLLATVSTLTALVRQLPAQNVLLVAAMIAGIGSAAQVATVKAGIPFGPILFGPAAGWKLFGTLPWIMPLLWVVMVLNSRGVARLVLRPWRKTRAYGFWLMGFTALFTMLLDCALEPFATHLKHYWIWTANGFSLTPQGGPVSNPVGWFIVTLLMLAFATPALINKQLSKRSSPDLHPLAVWLGAVLLFGSAAAGHGFWVVAGVDTAIGLVTAGFAIRGARW